MIRTFLICCFLFVVHGWIWSEPPQPLSSAGSQQTAKDEYRIRLERDMAKKANLERQAELQRDTDRLVNLATELKKYVAKSNENVLSVDVVKKAEQIEKLAHSVKEKMRGSN